MTEPAGHDLVEHDHNHAKATYGNTLFMVWRRRTMVDAYRRGMRIVERIAAEQKVKVGVFQVVEVDAIPPDSETRSAFVEFLRMKQVDHFSVTHDGSGFKAASVRAIVAGVHALARPTCAHAVHSSLGEAARWHAQHLEKLGRRESPAQLEAVMTALRKFHRETYP